ncbi:TPA: hypothetical protein ACF2DJ_002800 [Clostridium perfringens]|uniref:hypothetical protein n=1 Tax=Clostridium perfringens TaxID=1502 RepID=UPI001A2A6780|nr:hypothetical protein [Clostridium perfringens]HAT4296451.1 hypothetical protein [Clostridium perfringens]HAT4321452.1 hypothetical protein [Clostridium perfringens]
MGNIFILIIFWCCINSDNIFAKMFRYIAIIYGITHFWSALKAFELGNAFTQIFCICFLFFPKIIYRINQIFLKNNDI